MKTQKSVHPSAERKLGEIGRSIDDLLERSRMMDAAVRVRAEIVKELKRIDEQVTTTRARIDRDVAVTRKDFIDALRAELDVWKARLQELDVQAALGRMEVRDRLNPVLRHIESELAGIKKDVEALAETDSGGEEALTRSIERSMKSLRKEIETADELC